MTYNLDWLKDKFDKGDKIKFIFFWGHTNRQNEEVGKFVFSQWFPSPFVVDNIQYKTSEHWMMAHKAKLFSDSEACDLIIKADKPAEVKEIGRQIRGFSEIKWNEKKYEVVRLGNIHKFHQNKKLKDYLLGTADRVIVEASPTDSVWGIGVTQDEKMVDDPHTWRGANLLGFALMEVRDFLRQLGDVEYIKEEFVPPSGK